ncbi:MAG TPA: DNA/RNA helicase domain-containing protein [Bacilli bacterium]
MACQRNIPKEKRSYLPQIEEILRAAKVNVFFIDDAQMVRPNEIGLIKYIKDTATKFQCRVLEFELEAQFRCGGSDGCINWINNMLGVQKTANVLWDTKESFELRIFDTPWNLENAIKEKVAQANTGRLTAGFCWGWSDPNADGTLKEDVTIGDLGLLCVFRGQGHGALFQESDGVVYFGQKNYFST